MAEKNEVFFTGLSSEREVSEVCCYLCQRVRNSKSYHVMNNEPYERRIEKDNN